MKIIYKFFSVLIFLYLVSVHSIAQTSGWTIPNNISNTPHHSTSPAISINKARELFVIWSEFDQPPSDLYARIYFTAYVNLLWTVPVPITTELGKADWTPDIAVDTLGNPHIVWGEWLSGDVFYKYFDGSIWSDNINVSETQGGAFYPCIAIGHDNIVHIGWQEGGKACYRELKGNHWSDRKIISDNGGSIKICTDSNGDVHFTWGSYGPNNYEWKIWYRKLENNILIEPEIVYFDTTQHTSANPDVAVFNNDLPAIVWRQTTQSGPLPVITKIFYSEHNGIEWSEAEVVSDSSRSYRPDISIGKNIPYLVWDYEGNVLFAYKVNDNWIVPENLSYQLQYNSGGAKIITDANENISVIWQYGEPSPNPTGEIYYSYHDKITSVIEDNNLLSDYNIKLYQNYPNPFNPITQIRYSLPQDGLVSLKIFDILGREVITLVNEEKPAGEYTVDFNASSINRQISSGVYFYTIIAGEFKMIRKMVLAK